jgi:hypothetical protein
VYSVAHCFFSCASDGRALLFVFAAAARFAFTQAVYSGGSGTVEVVVLLPPCCAWLAELLAKTVIQ